MTYYWGACHFFASVEQHCIGELADIDPIHVATYIAVLQTPAAKPTVTIIDRLIKRAQNEVELRAG